MDTAVAIQAEDTGCTGMVAVEVPPVSDTGCNLKVEIKTAGFAHRLRVEGPFPCSRTWAADEPFAAPHPRHTAHLGQVSCYTVTV